MQCLSNFSGAHGGGAHGEMLLVGDVAQVGWCTGNNGAWGRMMHMGEGCAWGWCTVWDGECAGGVMVPKGGSAHGGMVINTQPQCLELAP